MKKRALCFCLALLMLFGLLPQLDAHAAADQNDLLQILSQFAWYDAWNDYSFNCTDATHEFGTSLSEQKNIITGIVTETSCLYVNRYGKIVEEFWNKADPKGRWTAHKCYNGEKLEWVLKNILNISDADIVTLRERVKKNGYSYYYNGNYYTSSYGIGDGFAAKNPTTRSYGKNLTLCSFRLYDALSNDYVGDRYAVVGKKTLNGTQQWSIYYYGRKAPSTTGFLDVDDTAYYKDPVLWAGGQGVTAGVSDYAFAPNQGCTRAQAVTFLWRAFGSQAPVNKANPFTDVKSSDYFYQPVLWAVERGITMGTSAKTFSPNETCTRAQIVTFLYRTAGEPRYNGSNPFTDVPKGAYYETAVKWAVGNKITSGTSARAFSPNETCSRAQIVTFLYRFKTGGVAIQDGAAKWLGVWKAADGEYIEIKSVNNGGFAMTYHGWTASGAEMFHTDYTAIFTNDAKTVATRPYVLSDPNQIVTYTLSGSRITATPPVGRGLSKDFIKQ